MAAFPLAIFYAPMAAAECVVKLALGGIGRIPDQARATALSSHVAADVPQHRAPAADHGAGGALRAHRLDGHSARDGQLTQMERLDDIDHMVHAHALGADHER